MRHEPDLTSASIVAHPSDRLDIGELARACSHVSFDVFDTLLVRLVWEPTDVFRLVAKQLGDPEFSRKRVRAEREARRLQRTHGHEDITIDDIYADPALSQRAQQLELDAERVLCVGNPTFLEAVAEARANGKKVIATSDMYLPSDFIGELLTAAGFGEFDGIYASGERGVGKGSGNLFRTIMRELDLEPQQICHIGDNRRSDYEVPRSLGMKAVHHPSVRERLLSDGLVNPAIIRDLTRSRDPAASVIAGLIAWGNLTEGERFEDYWYQTGFAVAGPLAYGFTAWIAERAKALEVETIYFMARDGHLPLKIYERYFTGPPGRYLLSSRRAMFVPSIGELDDRTLGTLTDFDARVPIRQLFTRLGIEPPPGLDQILTRRFGGLDKTVGTARERQRIASVFREHEAWLLRAAEEEREAALGYLETIGFLEANRRALVDIGWNGSTQYYLERFTSGKNYGLYFGLLETGYDNGINEAFAFFKGVPKSLRRTVKKSPEYFEMILSAEHPAIEKYDRAAGSPRPVEAELNPFEAERLEKASAAHSGAMNFCDLFDMVSSHFRLEVSPTLATMPANCVLSHPSKLDLLHYGDLNHSPGIGNSKYFPVVSSVRVRPVRVLRGLLFRDSTLVDTKSYWKLGYVHRHFNLPNIPGVHVSVAFVLRLFDRVWRVRLEGGRELLSAIRRKLTSVINRLSRSAR